MTETRKSPPLALSVSFNHGRMFTSTGLPRLDANMMKETERVRGGDVVGGRLSHMTSVYVFSPGRGEQPQS